MKKMIITVITALLAGFMVACGGEKKIDPVKAEAVKQLVTTGKVNEVSNVVQEPVLTTASKSKISIDATATVPGFSQGNTGLSMSYEEFNALLVEPTDDQIERLKYMTSGDVYFTVVLDDKSHYICTSVDELVKILVMKEYFGRSGDMITASDVEEYLSDYMFDNYLNGQFRRKMSVILESLAGYVYTERPNDSTYKNWESRGR